MNFLITGAWQQASDYFVTIERYGHYICFLQYESDELPCDPAWVEGIIGNGIFLSHSIEKFVNLKYIQLTSAGFDRVPMQYVTDHSIELHNARGVYSIPMAEFAVAGVLKLIKRLGAFHDNQNKKEWFKIRDLQELFGKKVVIIGCGSVGTACAKRFKAFDTLITGIDTVVRADENFDAIEPFSNIDEVLMKADIVVITVPLTAETIGMFNRERLKILKDGSVIVNIARGAIIQTDALVAELKTGRISAVLDVFDTEPLTNESPLWEMKNVVITPHNSFVSNNNNYRLSNLIIDNLKSKRNC